MNLIAQIVGFIGLGLVMATWQFNKRKQILYIQMLSGFVWTVHFALLGAYTGASINFLTAVRNYLFYKFKRDYRIFWAMIAASVIAVILTWKNWTSILPGIAIILGTYGMWQINPRTIRIVALVCPIFWFVYNILNGSYPGMIADTFAFFAILAGIIRFDVIPSLRKRKRGHKS